MSITGQLRGAPIAACGFIGIRKAAQTVEREALTLVAAAREAVFDRLDWQLARLRRELETAARFADEGAAIVAELAAMASGVGDQIQDTGRIVDRRLSPASCTEFPL